MSSFAHKVQKYLEDTSAENLARRLEMSPTTVKGWRDGTSQPRLDNLQALAKVTGTPILYWCDDRIDATEPERVAAALAALTDAELRQLLEANRLQNAAQCEAVRALADVAREVSELIVEVSRNPQMASEAKMLVDAWLVGRET